MQSALLGKVGVPGWDRLSCWTPRSLGASGTSDFGSLETALAYIVYWCSRKKGKKKMQHGNIAFHIDLVTLDLGRCFLSLLFWKVNVADTLVGWQLFSSSTLHSMVFWVLLGSHLSNCNSLIDDMPFSPAAVKISLPLVFLPFNNVSSCFILFILLGTHCTSWND